MSLSLFADSLQFNTLPYLASACARQHVAFRASTVLLALTVGELLSVFAFCHASDSPLVGYKCWMIVGGVLALAVGFWQMLIARRIDYYIVNPPSQAANPFIE